MKQSHFEVRLDYSMLLMMCSYFGFEQISFILNHNILIVCIIFYLIII